MAFLVDRSSMTATLDALARWPVHVGFRPAAASLNFHRYSPAPTVIGVEIELKMRGGQVLSALDGRELRDARWSLTLRRGSPDDPKQIEGALIGFVDYLPADGVSGQGDIAAIHVLIDDAEFDNIRALVASGRLPTRISVGLERGTLSKHFGGHAWDVTTGNPLGVRECGFTFDDIATEDRDEAPHVDIPSNRDALLVAIAKSLAQVEKSAAWLVAISGALTALLVAQFV